MKQYPPAGKLTMVQYHVSTVIAIIFNDEQNDANFIIMHPNRYVINNIIEKSKVN